MAGTPLSPFLPNSTLAADQSEETISSLSPCGRDIPESVSYTAMINPVQLTVLVSQSRAMIPDKTSPSVTNDSCYSRAVALDTCSDDESERRGTIDDEMMERE